jgi:hypothetical protein
MATEGREDPRRRFGIGEWYGQVLQYLTSEQKKRFGSIQRMKGNRPRVPCPFRGDEACNKKGGVCSLRLYEESPDVEGTAKPVTGDLGHLRITCPNRFLQGGTVFEGIGQLVLNTDSPIIVKEVGFLSHPRSEDGAANASEEDVGRIDMVMVHPETSILTWCAVEMQAVYFSGSEMGVEFDIVSRSETGVIPFPAAHRRPDYRSSGPKRLMPQLQIKVPTLRRWGKKMVVVVDKPFFEALGPMGHEKDLSNCDIVWFVVGLDETAGRVVLRKELARFTTLERAVEGLTGGIPVGLNEFELRIKEKLSLIS